MARILEQYIPVSFTKNVTILRREWEQDAMEVKLISLSVVGVDKTEMVNFVKPDDDTKKAPNIGRQPGNLSLQVPERMWPQLQRQVHLQT